MSWPAPDVAPTNDRRFDALAHFKDWSNYLLVTTVAAGGWVGSDKVTFANASLQAPALWCLGISIVFGIFTLAFIPLIAQQLERDVDAGIYDVPIVFHLFGVRCVMYLPQMCRPQHLTFIAGVVLFCAGTVESYGAALATTIVAVALVFISKPQGKSNDFELTRNQPRPTELQQEQRMPVQPDRTTDHGEQEV